MSVPANVDVILQGSAIAEALRQRCVLIFGGTKLCPVPPGGMRTDGKASMATCSQIVSPCVTFATLTTWTVLTGRQRTRLIFRDIQGHSGTVLFCSTWVRPSQMSAEQTRQDYRWSGEACLPHATWGIWVSTPTIWIHLGHIWLALSVGFLQCARTHIHILCNLDSICILRGPALINHNTYQR